MKKVLTNYQIVKKYKKVNVVTAHGLESVSSKEALEKAELLGVDLVKVSENKTGIICKIMDYQKYLYDKKKKERKSKKNISIKEIRLSLDMSQNDLSYRITKAKGFIDKGAILKVSLGIKGRHMKRKQDGKLKYDTFFSQLADSCEYNIKYQSEPKLNGRFWNATIVKSK